MKRLLTLFLVLGLVACMASVANAVVVIGGAVNNGNMNDTAVSSQILPTPVGYVVVSDFGGPFSDGGSSEGFADVDGGPGDCGGAGCGFFYKAFFGGNGFTTPQPSPPNITTHLYQDNPGTPGMLYKFHGWFGAGASYSGLFPGVLPGTPAGTMPTTSEMALEFLDAGSSVIGGSTLDLQAGLIANQGNGNPFGYAEYWVMATAPAGTATVRVRGSSIDGYLNPAGGDQAMVTDLWTLTCIPEPTSVALGLIGVLGMLGLIRRR
ncbi:MAG: hypothetical protein L0228_06060 [Planctomycetes bacterium]|nr:hypothetical protein [Planctomycetota bacterium]